MNNRSSISWWLGQLGLSQYSKVLEREYYGLEGLLCVTDADLREAGVENQTDRELILSHIKQHHHNESQHRGAGSPGPHCSPAPRRVSRKHSLGSSLDLLRSPKRSSGHGFSLFRQSILPRLRKKDKTSSCIQLPTLQERQSTATSTLRHPSTLQERQSTATSTLRHPSTLQERQSTATSTLSHPSTLQERQSTATSTLRNPSTRVADTEETQLLTELLHNSRRTSVDAHPSPVKAAFEKCGMDSTKEKLKKELEEELKLSSEDLRSHAWYHGKIRREAAEALLETDGEFLIRDSQSSPGDYVLTCQWRDQPMHFRIIRVVLRPKKGYSRMLFQFEQDQFDNVPALVRCHVGNRKPISDKSGAIISQPITRSVPLRVIEEQQGSRAPQGNSEEQHPSDKKPKRLSLNGGQQDIIMNGNLLRNKDKSGSHPGNLEDLGRRPSLQSAQSDSNLRSGATQTSHSNRAEPPPPSPVFRTGSEPLLSPNLTRASVQPQGGPVLRGSDGQLHSRAPPKPLRIPSVIFTNPPPEHRQQNPEDYYGELVPRAALAGKGHVDRLAVEERWQSRARMTDTSFQFLDAVSPTLSAFCEQEEGGEEGGEDPHFVRPQIETVSSFQPSCFQSLLLPENNKPLEPSVLKRLKEVFAGSDARTTALHILKVDCQVARMMGVTKEQRQLMGVGSGLELLTLPHGHQLRLDLLERHHLIALGIAVDVLGCTGTVSQRASVLNKVIQLSAELKNTVGDLYAFSAVMKALEMPQIASLEMTWRALRRNHTESAIAFEKQLKPFYKALNQGKDETPLSRTAVPHILPLVKLMEGVGLGEDTEESCEQLLKTLAAARAITLNAGLYSSYASSLLKDFKPKEELLEVFKTEFALRLFWGFKGAEAKQEERYQKFDKILSVLAGKLETGAASEL
ncbi:hypothetical protein AOXY_G29225 [Acipenser oxyrinchus oxyrinchus]|uniref:Breast cancer anti-estrogen resistance protein 3 n=1 Tax=Acipenser oxyrinchus oxyrinchus TaxID=40147 RepID=A0AAD8FW47_ACIOX|nr:hypothetical protein AOXY_G29225 [Acipenser oxyrinchus oxyrinchus]